MISYSYNTQSYDHKTTQPETEKGQRADRRALLAVYCFIYSILLWQCLLHGSTKENLKSHPTSFYSSSFFSLDTHTCGDMASRGVCLYIPWFTCCLLLYAKAGTYAHKMWMLMADVAQVNKLDDPTCNMCVGRPEHVYCCGCCGWLVGWLRWVWFGCPLLSLLSTGVYVRVRVYVWMQTQRWGHGSWVQQRKKKSRLFVLWMCICVCVPSVCGYHVYRQIPTCWVSHIFLWSCAFVCGVVQDAITWHDINKTTLRNGPLPRSVFHDIYLFIAVGLHDLLLLLYSLHDLRLSGDARTVPCLERRVVWRSQCSPTYQYTIMQS